MNELTIKELEEKYGSVQYEGRRYVLTQNAYCDSPLDGPYFFRANAICPDDEIEYEVTWETTEEFDKFFKECNGSGDWLDEGDACDWDKPYNVRQL